MTHREALAIAERLAATDPDNAEHQRDLAVSHDRLGTSPPPSHEPRSPGV
jgi:Flp pilus assembly protein TadD